MTGLCWVVVHHPLGCWPRLPCAGRAGYLDCVRVVRADVTGVAFGPADVGGGDCGNPAQVVGERGATVDMPRGMARATIHSHQRGHLVTSKIWTIWVPAPAGSRVMRQSLLSTNSGVGMVRQAIWRGGSTATTSHVRLQRSQPARLRPRKRAPGAAAVAPPSQLTWRHSWLHCRSG